MARGVFAGNLPERRCCECGGLFKPKRPGSLFCCTEHNTEFRNRRMARGAQLYDLFMEIRYNRAGATGLWSVMCRLAEAWREEDKKERKDFTSWQDPAAMIEEEPHLIARRGRV